MSVDKMDSSAVYTLFEELKQKITESDSKTIGNLPNSSNSDDIIKLLNELKNLIDQKRFTPEQVEELRRNIGGFATDLWKKSNEKTEEVSVRLTNLLNQINENILSKNEAPTNTIIRKEHVFSLDFKNSKAVMSMIVMGLAILVSVSININQYRNNKTYKDTDLKYRYIKMYRGISNSDFIWLENVFYYPDSAYIVKNIKKGVLDYEHKLEQQVRKQEQIRINDEKNKQLNKDIENLGVR